MITASPVAALRSRLCEAIRERVEELGTRAMGRRLGCDGSTVSRWGTALHAWSAAALLDLAADDAGVAGALHAVVEGAAPQGQAVRARGSLLDELSTAAAIQGLVARALHDGRLDPAEARAIAAALRRRQKEEAVLLADLDAAAASGRGP